MLNMTENEKAAFHWRSLFAVYGKRSLWDLRRCRRWRSSLSFCEL